jgi:chromosome partitioning protein
MDPVDPKRRGRRLFGGRRRHEHAAEAEMDQPTTTTAADAQAPDEPPETETDLTEGDAIETAAPSGDAPEHTEPTAESEPVMAVDEATADMGEARTVEVDEPESPGASPEGAPAPEPGEPEEAGSDASDSDTSEETDAAEGDEIEPYDLPRIVAIANQKGGVGKTTTSVNLGAALAEMGYRVLVVDLDPQGNATTGLGVNARELEGSVYDVIMNDTPVEDCVEPTSLKNLFVVPATIDLAGAEIELVPAFSRELKLRRALHELREDYDYMLIDCPPSLGLLTVNGLAAADDVIVPIQCEYYALEGLSQLIRNVSLVQKNLNPSLDVRGIVLTMYDARTKLADQVEQEVRKHFSRTVYQTVIPRTVRLSEAPSFGQPIILFDPTSRGAIAYRELAKEVSSGATRRTG